MKAVINVERKYYKYTYEQWTQPVLTGNITTTPLGNVTVSASSVAGGRTIYGAMDGVNSGGNASRCWITNGTSVGWWQVVFPYKIKITAMTHYNPLVDNSCATEGAFYTDSSKNMQIGDSINTPNQDWYATQIANIPQAGIITDTIYFHKTNQPYGGIGELSISATRISGVVESTIDDYDYYEDVSVCKLLKENNTYNAFDN